MLGFEFSIQSSVYGATTVAKVSLFSTWSKFLLYVSVEIDPFSCTNIGNLAPKLTFFTKAVYMFV